ncbi:MAG TPA: hypothetical protein VHE79_09320, partial [Spirochaetia bacterium]
THVGWGRAVAGKSAGSPAEHGSGDLRYPTGGPAEHGGTGRAAEVWVVDFTRRDVADLQLVETTGGTQVSGRLVPVDATAAVLLDGAESLPPASWDIVTRRFVFLVPSEGYYRLGYVDAKRDLVLTNAFLLPRGDQQ